MRDHRPDRDPTEPVDITDLVRRHIGDVSRAPTPPRRKPQPRKIRKAARRRAAKLARKRNR